MGYRQLRGWLVRVRGLFGREQLDRELAEEFEAHLQMQIDDNLRAGMTHAEAERNARLKLGGMESAKEEYRFRRGLPWIETTVKDLRYAARILLRSPSFTIIAILSLALGIGANTAVFSLINTAILRPLPVEHPREIVTVVNADRGHMFPTFSYPNYRDFRDRNTVMTGLYAYRFAPISLSHDGINEKLWGYLVTGNYFPVLGVRAFLGRTLGLEDDRLTGAHPVTVLGFHCWQRRFGSDPNVINRNVIVNGRGYTIIGVLPPEFYGTEVITAPEMWFPMAMQEQVEPGNSWLEKRDADYVFMQGRLKPDVDLRQAEAAFNTLARQLEVEFPDVNEDLQVSLSKAGLSGRFMRGAVLGFAEVLMVVVGIVLLLACVNLSNLLLARALDRRKEISVRLALGAGRMRLIRQLLAESMLLSITGGICGALLASWLLKLASSIAFPIDFPLAIHLHMDVRVLIFAILISVGAGIVFGLLPALQATRVDVISTLKDETMPGFSRGWLRSGLIVLQLALSLVLLVGGGLMVRALQNAQAVPLGFHQENAVEVSFDLRLQGYDEDRGLEFQRLLLDRVRRLPNVQSAGLTDLAPVDLHFGRSSVFIEGAPTERNARPPVAMTNRIGPGYLEAMGTRLIAGRDFSEHDDRNAPTVALINETFARRFWPGQDPIGKRFSRGAPDGSKMEVIGVLEDGKYAGLNEDPQPYYCRSLLQSFTGSTTVIARATKSSQTVLTAIRNQVQQMDPQMPISSARPLAARMAIPLLPARFSAMFLGGFGVLALLLVAIGIYGVMSCSVSRRRHEIGVRMALGARASQVLKLTIRQGMILALAGLLIGLPAAWTLARLVRRMLYGVSTTDPVTYAGVLAMLIAVAFLACYVPARRAASIDPMAALRNE